MNQWVLSGHRSVPRNCPTSSAPRGRWNSNHLGAERLCVWMTEVSVSIPAEFGHVCCLRTGTVSLQTDKVGGPPLPASRRTEASFTLHHQVLPHGQRDCARPSALPPSLLLSRPHPLTTLPGQALGLCPPRVQGPTRPHLHVLSRGDLPTPNLTPILRCPCVSLELNHSPVSEMSSRSWFLRRCRQTPWPQGSRGLP